ncbi:hypothetical protein Q7P35_004061 [Cladosporium inversicolor]
MTNATQLSACKTCSRAHNPRIRKVETQTSQKLSIKTLPTPENLASCHPQSQSPLFSTLPAEIRNYIFSLALLQYEDLANPYEKNALWYRPGHRARHIVSTSLLLTCRLVWLEANHWPMTQAVHYFWYHEGNRPDWAQESCVDDELRVDNFFSRLSDVQFLRVKRVQIFADVGWLEWTDGSDFRERVGLQRHPLRLDNFKVTVRHVDWKGWEFDGMLRLSSSWLRSLLRSPEATHFAEFCLELETLEWKVVRLRRIVEKLRSAAEAKKGEDVRWELVGPFEETTWSGPTDLDDDELHAQTIYEDRDKLDYRIITMKWKRLVPTELEQRWKQKRSLLKLSEPPRPIARTECNKGTAGSDSDTDREGSAYSDSNSE